MTLHWTYVTPLEPCPNGCGNATEDPYGGPCRICMEAEDDLDDPRPIGRVGADLHPDWS